MRQTILLFAALALSGSAYAQWLPITSDYKETQSIVYSNGTKERHELTGKFYRSSDGSTLLTYTDTIQGGTQKHAGRLMSMSGKAFYFLNYDSGTAVQGRTLSPPPSPKEMTVPASLVLAEATIDGYPCQILPMKDSKGNVIGRIWHPTGLQMPEIREETDLPPTAEMKAHVSREWTNIKTGQEPDPSMFQTYKRMKLLAPAPKAQ